MDEHGIVFVKTAVGQLEKAKEHWIRYMTNIEGENIRNCKSISSTLRFANLHLHTECKYKSKLKDRIPFHLY